MHGLGLAVEKLQALGYRRLGLAMPVNFDERVNRSWLASLLLYQYELPPEDRVPPLLETAFDLPGFPAWFRKHRPDVVLSPHLAAHGWLAKLGLRVPDDVGFVHLDRSAAELPCAGIDQKPDQLGAVAVDLVVSDLQRNQRGIPASPKLVYLEGEWVDGDSVRQLRDSATSSSTTTTQAEDSSRNTPRRRKAKTKA
jgi:LacI family transcriptional regulator